ncbi:MAG: hypothetical protein COU08_00295 [Candidatus Harrisonbacteria bacterium CG10_big_fil_rev_8_21_14_0_10_42_17]|uniref:Resolvase HTH domain-containing protein n=1 Tax=Candidatus Harrisonbacteria bacterium CG10_big_fil_rev_8_21_14_0_10_42_17 TaxID=1974584 RepID=A0A2M6WJ84_9BACT|nr:MAG: hypothetical protein COU08_00295 [Candidatus Harrisonbacteria bacterium CG10_big_fil_rev_8_21_14_0_10_42_17]
MARFRDREKALELRRQGKSYSQIKNILKVGKSTLSYWLKDYPLSQERIRELRDWSEQRIERCRETKRRKKEKRLAEVYEAQRRELLPFSKRDFLIAGLFLYWGEGSKRERELAISNTDPAIIKLFISWLEQSFGVSRKKLRVQLQLYEDMNVDRELIYWIRTLKLSKSQFIKPYIKRTLQSAINHKGAFGHGTCKVSLGDARLSERVFMGLRVFTHYSEGM